MLESSKVLLQVSQVSVRFGGVVALDRVCLDVRLHQICGLIGPNGSGKTTLFNVLSRLVQPHSGTLLLSGQSVLSLASHELPNLGVGRTFQNLALFNSLSVRDNVLVGAHRLGSPGFFRHLFQSAALKAQEAQLRHQVDELLHQWQLHDWAHQRVSELPLALQKRVALVRALASRPRLLLLDEPAAGLSPTEIEDLAQRLCWLRDGLGITVLLVEHHMGLVMAVSDEVAVLNFGRRLAQDRPQVIQRHPEVLQAYLGGADVFA